jgi:PAS domain S-box-containing protein
VSAPPYHREQAAPAAPAPDAQLALGLVEAAPDALVVMDERGVIRFVNAQADALFGYRREELVGQPVEKLVPLHLREANAASRGRYLAHPSTRRMGQRKVTLSARRRDGSELPVDVSLSPVRLGEALYVVAALRDASERRRTESALRGSAAYTRAALEQAPDAIFTADLQGRYTDVNAAACQMLGYTREELIGKSIADLIPAEELPRLAAARRRLLVPGETEISEWRLRRKDGQLIPVEVNAKILGDGRWQAIVRDISDRKRVESLLSLHAILVDKMAEGLVLVRAADDHIVYTNPRFDRMLGYRTGELIGQPIAVVNHEDGTGSAAEVVRSITAALAAKRELTVELPNVRKDGRVIWCRVQVISFDHPEVGLVWLAVHQDITEQRQAQQAAEKMRTQLALADRMSSLGTLAAGVAHEINNPLTYVISNLALAAVSIRELPGRPSKSQLQELVQLIEEAGQGAESVRKIVRGLGALSRAGDDHPVALDVREVLESSIKITSHELRQKARLVKQYRAVPPVRADEARLGQVFVNLLVNAAQAIPDGRSGDNEIRVTLATDAAGRVVVEIRDTGVGIPAETLGRVFDPFFTTKSVGKGTGLGLSISHNIVTSLGGAMEVESEVGRGSAFRVLLPASVAEPEPPAGEPTPGPVGPVGRASVLIVDDDPMVAKSLCRALDGHEVQIAGNGKHALDLLREGRQFDVIVCDLMMPVMTGMELHAALTRERPELLPRMVFITGGVFTAGAGTFLEQVPNARLEKPFSADNLRAIVGKMLSALARQR